MGDVINKGYQALSIASEYRSFRTDIVKEFFIPVLSETGVYKRAVGFFSSSSLLEVSEGITGLVKNNGYIQLISSPYLSEDDFEAIKRGYSERDRIRNILINHLLEPSSYFEEQRLNILANLIKDGSLNIKIAFTKNISGLGLYHEKMGIANDFDGNVIAFSGSLNESQTAFKANYEAIDVFCSWKNQDQLSRVNLKVNAFNTIWDNNEPNMVTMEFPEVKEEIIKKYLKAKPNLDVDFDEFGNMETDALLVDTDKNKIQIRIPDGISLYDYQVDAIDEWQNHDFRGIFDMATGTGKTLTALGGIVRLNDFVDGKLGIVIVCPFQHLVEQWVEDILSFGIDPIIGYSKSSQRDWKNRLSSAVRDQKLKVKNKVFFCFVTTNATYRSEFVQNQVTRIKDNALLLVDEAHNFGAESLREMLHENFKYRLALSATLERHNDEIGTNYLLNYFGEKCIYYTLERAIAEKKLTQYNYYPVLVTLSAEELEAYIEITNRLSKCIVKDKNGKETLNQLGKKLAIQRARIIAGAKNKLNAIREEIKPYRDESHILVYCGAASILEPDEDETPINSEELRQIDQVTFILGDELKMKVSQFTSKEDIEERKTLKKEFERGEMLQALIAIKCLDEGVNIPKIKTAFILASTTNPKEYIQRRGRVLRLSEGKEYSTIYDFITIPYDLHQVSSLTSSEIGQFKTLVKNELSRGYEFSRIALNSFEAERILSELEEAYRIPSSDFDVQGELHG
jgi:superfamily II DNA or RNA helicase